MTIMTACQGFDQGIGMVVVIMIIIIAIIKAR